VEVKPGAAPPAETRTDKYAKTAAKDSLFSAVFVVHRGLIFPARCGKLFAVARQTYFVGEQ
jgi:hypothetical protein